MIAREPTSALAVDAHARHGRAAVAQRADDELAHRQQVDALVVDRLQRQRDLDGVARDASRAARTAWPSLVGIGSPSIMVADAARRRRRQHPDPLRHVPTASELVEHWRFATVRQSTADELGAALRNLLELRGYGFDDLRGVDRLLDRAAARARVDGDGQPLPGPRDARRRPGHEDGHGDPLRQPARDRRRPARQRRRDPRALRRARRCAWTSARRPPSTSSRATASTSAAR